ncbi:MAG: metallophosphoesterase family protein [Thermoplasmatota archaeon]
MIESIGVIADIHSNPEALENVMSRLSDVERIFCLGDIIGIGPRPAEALSIVMNDRRIVSVYGNHEYNTVNGTEIGPIRIFPRAPHHAWVRKNLTDRQLEYLGGLPAVIREVHGGIRFTLMHCHPDNCGAFVPYYDDPSPSVLDHYYEGVEGDVLLFGHTHRPLDVTGKRRYLNPGPVGAQNGGIARFMRIDIKDERMTLVRLSEPYDRSRVVSDLKRYDVPNRRFISRVFYGD